jgi:hypothetical protein
MASDEHLLLKWGTLKGWDVGDNAAARAALECYHNEPVSYGCAQQHDTSTQKQALCNLIDAINGPITNDWTGDEMTKEAAKEYVRNYGKREAA